MAGLAPAMIARCGQFIDALELLGRRDHPVLVNSFMGNLFEQRLGYESADIQCQTPGFVYDVQSERYRYVANMLAASGRRGIAAEVKARSRDLALHAAARKRDGEEGVRSQIPGAQVAHHGNTRKGREKRVVSAVIDNSGCPAGRPFEHVVRGLVVAQCHPLIEPCR
jgi:hypothetical protein